MDLPRIELGSPDCQPDIIPVYYKPMDSSGIGPELRRILADFSAPAFIAGGAEPKVLLANDAFYH